MKNKCIPHRPKLILILTPIQVNLLKFELGMTRIVLVQPVFSGVSTSKPVNGALICLNHASLFVDLLLVQMKRNWMFIFASSAYSSKRRIPCRQKPIITVLPPSFIPQVTVKPFWPISSVKPTSVTTRESFWRLQVNITNWVLLARLMRMKGHTCCTCTQPILYHASLKPSAAGQWWSPVLYLHQLAQTTPPSSSLQLVSPRLWCATFPSSPTCSSLFLSEEMVSADQISGPVNIQKVQDDIVKLWNVVKSQPEISEEQKHHIKALYNGVLHLLHKSPDSCLHWCPWKPLSIVSVLYAGVPLPPSGQGATTSGKKKKGT